MRLIVRNIMTDLLQVHNFYTDSDSDSNTDTDDEEQAIAKANSYCGMCGLLRFHI